jgi:hypothetical protein
VDPAGRQRLFARLRAGGSRGIGCEVQAVGTDHAEGEVDQRGVDVETVDDDTVRYARVDQGCPWEARLPVVQRAHRVKQVGHARDLPFNGLVGDLERGVRVAGGDNDPAPEGCFREPAAPSSSGARVSILTGPRPRSSARRSASAGAIQPVG